MSEVKYDHGEEIVINSLEELKELVSKIPENVMLSILIDEEGHYE